MCVTVRAAGHDLHTQLPAGAQHELRPSAPVHGAVRCDDKIRSEQLAVFTNQPGNVRAADLFFAFDQHLFCYTADSGFSIWHLETHRRIFHDAKFHPLAYHPELKIFLAQTDKGLTINRLA